MPTTASYSLLRAPTKPLEVDRADETEPPSEGSAHFEDHWILNLYASGVDVLRPTGRRRGFGSLPLSKPLVQVIVKSR